MNTCTGAAGCAAGREDGVHLTFLKDIYTEAYLQKMELNERLIKAVMYVKGHGSLTNSKYQKIVEVSKASATRNLQELEAEGILRETSILSN